MSSKKLDLNNLDEYNGGYGATFVDQEDSNIPCYTLDEIEKTYNLNFNVLVADCEGFLERFFNENPDFYDKLCLVIFEADYPEKCNYTKIRDTLREKGFQEIVWGHQNVWERPEV